MSTGPDLLQHLNDTQAQAADHYTGPALVIAGAGSGKTRTLIYRIAHLIGHYGVNPGEILAVTFTNKAAAEMRERASHLVPGADRLWMSTFHSAGVRILRAYGEHIGLRRGFVIYDDDDQQDILKEIMGSIPGIGPDTSPRVLRAIIDRAKSNLLTPADLGRSGEPFISGLPREAAHRIRERGDERRQPREGRLGKAGLASRKLHEQGFATCGKQSRKWMEGGCAAARMREAEQTDGGIGPRPRTGEPDRPHTNLRSGLDA